MVALRYPTKWLPGYAQGSTWAGRRKGGLVLRLDKPVPWQQTGRANDTNMLPVSWVVLAHGPGSYVQLIGQS